MKILFWIFYSATIILWFKDSFSQLASIPIDHRIPLVGLVVTSLVRLILHIKKKKPSIKIKFDKSVLFPILLVILAVAVRIPFLANHAGLSDSDDGLTMLMSKHIADGKLPPLYFYKQYYQGSLFSHISALMISFFGYSHLLMEITILFFFCAFILIQFYFLKKLFSTPFALIASAFFCLPIGHLVKCSFFISSAYPLVLLLGSAILFMAYLVVDCNKTHLIPVLGFLIGLAFWAHQISVIFILTAAILLLPKIRLLWKKYLSIIFYALMGCLPLIIAEIFWDFHLVRYLMPGDGNSIGGMNLKRFFEMGLQIISQSPNILSYVFFLLLVLGLVSLLYPSLKARRLQPQSLFSLFFLLFVIIYFISRFGQKNVIRYFYTLYFCLPVLFLGFLWAIRSRFKYLIMSLAILLMFFGLNLKGVRQDLDTVKKNHQQRIETLRAMKDTGQRYWRADFWNAYMLTALSGEELIVDSYSVNRYFPYRLMYENEGGTENFVFLAEGQANEKRFASRFTRLLEACHWDYRKKELEANWLVYDIQTPVSQKAMMAPVHAGFPEAAIVQAKNDAGFLDLTLTNIGDREGSDYEIHAEIPGYSSVTKGFPAAKDEVEIRIPAPQKSSFLLEFYLSYKGIKIAQTHRKISYNPPEEFQARKKRFVFLTGVRPRVQIKNKKMYPCAKNVEIEINGKLENFSSIRIELYSPFDFSDPAWYGIFAQETDIRINGEAIQKVSLDDGSNVISIPLEGLSLEEDANILTLRFKYHLFFNFAPFGKTGALLERIGLDR